MPPAFLQRTAATLLTAFDPAVRSELNPAQRAELRARQMDSVLSLGPVMLGANVFNAAVVIWLFRDSPSRPFVLAWALALALVVACAAVAMRAQRRRSKARGARRGPRRLTFLALGLGLLWAAPVTLFPVADPGQRQILEMCVAGIVTGGAIALAPVWTASLAFSGALLAPAMLMFMRESSDSEFAVFALGLSFAAIIIFVVRDRNRMFTANFIQTVRLQSSNARLAGKVEEFEEFGESTFETDAFGRLLRVSKRFATLLRVPEKELVGAPLFGLVNGALASRNPARDESMRQIIRRVRSRVAFRDVALKLHGLGEPRWIAVSAEPLFNDGRFSGYRGSIADVTETKRAEAALAKARNTDDLTGLANREQFLARLAQRLLRANGKRFAVFAIDLNRFRNVNEVVGREAADHVLRTCASRIAAVTSKRDVAARFGGDDFFVLAPGVDAVESAEALARRMLDALAQPIVASGVRLPIGGSVGVVFAPDDGSDCETLMRNAELAVLRGKNEGARVTFFDVAADAELGERRRLELQLMEAVEKQQLDLHFQPLIDVESGRVVCCEALLRWTHPVRGPIPPSIFVPIAEESGLIDRIGEWVLQKACAEAARWSGDVRVAVNLSPVQFRAGIVDKVRAALLSSGLAPQRLEIEITESVLIHDKERALQEMNGLRGLGVRLSLDDFGTGYASLSYLADMPFDKIKIDRSFVREVATRRDSGAIVRAITDLASRLGLNTTAEGVETLQDLEWLRAAGCKEAQGFLFSRAAPADEIRQIIARNGPEALGKVG